VTKAKKKAEPPKFTDAFDAPDGQHCFSGRADGPDGDGLFRCGFTKRNGEIHIAASRVEVMSACDDETAGVKALLEATNAFAARTLAEIAKRRTKCWDHIIADLGLSKSDPRLMRLTVDRYGLILLKPEEKKEGEDSK